MAESLARPVRILRLVLMIAAMTSAAAAAGGGASDPLKPYKDDLFTIEVTGSLFGGDYRYINYSKERDLYGRDEVVEKKAFAKFVSLDPSEVQKDLVLDAGGRSVRYIGVGKTSGAARFVVIFLHGDDGSRFQGVDDWSFGGNFNRLKNLAARNGGAYLSPDFPDFGPAGTGDIRALMQDFAARSPGAPIVVVCTSRSGKLCFHLLADKAASALLGGVILLGSLSEDAFFGTPVFTDPKRYVPIFIGHGSKDKLLDWVSQDLFFRKVKAAAPSYPIRFDVFVHGSHGTPMRLIDWREVLNWMLTLDGMPD